MTVSLDAGQTLSVAATPSSSLQPKVSIIGPQSFSYSDDAVLQNVVIAEAGAYTINVTGNDGSTGDYSLKVVLNGVFETESNDSSLTAQSLDGYSIFPLEPGADPLTPAAEHISVYGSLPPNTARIAWENFESGSLGANWTTYSSLKTGRIRITDQYPGTGNGTKALIMDDAKPLGTTTLNEAVWTVDLSGRTEAWLGFKHTRWDDYVDGFNGPFTGHYNADGIAISADGIKWYPAWKPGAQGEWATFEVNLAAIASNNGIALGKDFKIKFQQYGFDPIPQDGRGWDDIEIRGSGGGTAQDWYEFSLDANQSVTLTATTPVSAGVALELHDGTGKILQGGTSSNVDQAIVYESPNGGVYKALVTQDGYISTNYDYLLTVTKGATFDLERSPTQPLSVPAGIAIGALDASMEELVQSDSGGLRWSEKILFHNDDLYVASRLSDQIMRYDKWGQPKPATGMPGAVFASGNGLDSPLGFDFDSFGNLYVANYDANTVVKFDANGIGLGAVVDAGAGGLTSATGLAIQGNYLYVGSRDTDQIMRYDLATGDPRPSAGNNGAVFASGGGLDGPDGLKLGPDGNLYVASQFSDSIIRYDSNGNATVFVPPGTGGLDQPLAMAFSPTNDDLYVTSYANNQVLRFSHALGEFVEAVITPVPGYFYLDCTGLDFGPDNELYVTNRGANSVVRQSVDTYKLDLSAGGVITLETRTPLDGPLSPDNSLRPTVQLRDAEGNLLESAAGNAGDGQNARLWYQATSGGTYYVHIRPAAGTSGEYIVESHVYQGPMIIVDDVSVNESDTGAIANFNIRLLYGESATVDYATVTVATPPTGTATADEDYTSASGTVELSGTSQATVQIAINGDHIPEPNEIFHLKLSNASNGANIAFDGRAQATIVNDDTHLQISDTKVIEADSGTQSAVFTLTLSDPVPQSVEVAYATAPNTAIPGSDYDTTSGSVTFLPGETTKTIAVPVRGDLVAEQLQSESFYVNLTSASGADTYDNSAIGSILDNDTTASVINKVNFDNATDIALVGDASLYSPNRKTPKVLRLTPNTTGKAGAGWCSTTQVNVVDGFKTTFDFVMSGGGDGLAFVMQNVGTGVLGTNGQGLGYDGIANSVAVELDAYANSSGFGEPNDNHVAVQPNGSSDGSDSLSFAVPAFKLDDNAVHKAMIQYAGGVLQVYVDSTAAPLLNIEVELQDFIGGPSAWVGFTGATGGASYQTHDIRSWTYWTFASSLVAAGAADGSSPAAILDDGQVEPILDEALLRWNLAGTNTARLNGLDVRVRDLPGATLGLASGNTIWLDANAAGWGWFVDSSPRNNLEFVQRGDQGEQRRMDLLTVVMHELGHVLGYGHSDNGLMSETLAAGVRRTAVRGEHAASVDEIFLQAGFQSADGWPGGWLSDQFDLSRPWAKRRR